MSGDNELNATRRLADWVQNYDQHAEQLSPASRAELYGWEDQHVLDLHTLLAARIRLAAEVERLKAEAARLNRQSDAIIQREIDDRNRCRPEWERDGPQW